MYDRDQWFLGNPDKGFGYGDYLPSHIIVILYLHCFQYLLSILFHLLSGIECVLPRIYFSKLGKYLLQSS